MSTDLKSIEEEFLSQQANGGIDKVSGKKKGLFAIIKKILITVSLLLTVLLVSLFLLSKKLGVPFSTFTNPESAAQYFNDRLVGEKNQVRQEEDEMSEQGQTFASKSNLDIMSMKALEINSDEVYQGTNSLRFEDDKKELNSTLASINDYSFNIDEINEESGKKFVNIIELQQRCEELSLKIKNYLQLISSEDFKVGEGNYLYINKALKNIEINRVKVAIFTVKIKELHPSLFTGNDSVFNIYSNYVANAQYGYLQNQAKAKFYARYGDIEKLAIYNWLYLIYDELKSLSYISQDGQEELSFQGLKQMMMNESAENRDYANRQLGSVPEHAMKIISNAYKNMISGISLLYSANQDSRSINIAEDYAKVKIVPIINDKTIEMISDFLSEDQPLIKKFYYLKSQIMLGEAKKSNFYDFYFTPTLSFKSPESWEFSINEVGYALESFYPKFKDGFMSFLSKSGRINNSKNCISNENNGLFIVPEHGSFARMNFQGKYFDKINIAKYVGAGAMLDALGFDGGMIIGSLQKKFHQNMFENIMLDYMYKVSKSNQDKAEILIKKIDSRMNILLENYALIKFYQKILNFADKDSLNEEIINSIWYATFKEVFGNYFIIDKDSVQRQWAVKPELMKIEKVMDSLVAKVMADIVFIKYSQNSLVGFESEYYNIVKQPSMLKFSEFLVKNANLKFVDDMNLLNYSLNKDIEELFMIFNSISDNKPLEDSDQGGAESYERFNDPAVVYDISKDNSNDNQVLEREGVSADQSIKSDEVAEEVVTDENQPESENAAMGNQGNEVANQESRVDKTEEVSDEGSEGKQEAAADNADSKASGANEELKDSSAKLDSSSNNIDNKTGNDNNFLVN